jgi:DNA-binding protein YbaB
MAFDPIEHLAQARVESDRRSEHHRGRIVAMERTVDELRYRIAESERELAESRTTVGAGDGAVRVVVDGTGAVRAIELAERWYATAPADEVGAVVLAGLREAAGARPGPEPPAPTGIGSLDDLAQRLHALRLRLDTAQVRAATAAGDVTVVCDGHGTATQVTVRFTGAPRPTAGLLGEQLATAVRSAQQAAANLRDRAQQDSRAEALRAAGLPVRPPDPASIVRDAFGVAR